MKSRTKQEQVKNVLAIFRRLNPDPKCELFFLTPYQLLVSVVLSAQATDRSVNKCTEALYRAGFSPSTAVELGPDGILGKIRSIGLAPTKAKNIYNLSRRLLDDFHGQVPNDRAALESLPGVGRKTANVVLAELFNQPVLAVDTHVFRVGKRLGWHRATTPEKAEKALMSAIPIEFLPKAHHWLILHGRYVCKAIKPLCGDCHISEFCAYFNSKN